MTDKDYDAKLEAARAEVAASSLWDSNAFPPTFTIARSLGRKPVPPHYRGVLSNFLATGPVFAVIWGVFMWIFDWSRDGTSIGLAISAAGVAGVLFGLVMAGYYHLTARRHGLSRWEDL